ncbi:MAG: hypothetical protein MK137_06215 [Rickettsiales bacterium]|nr:hypothetical protein [Rickettsiales bacterium]
MIFSRTLFRYRDLNKQAENISSMQPDERDKLLSDIEKEDKKITRSETILKNTGNFMGLIGTASVAAATYLSAPIFPLAFGAVSLVGAIYAVSAGATIETQRNQSQTDTIRRILYKQKEKGYDLGTGIGKGKGKEASPNASQEANQANKKTKRGFLSNRDIAEDIAKAPADDSKKAHEALNNADQLDRKSTRFETYLKNVGYVLALLGTVSFAFDSFSFAPFIPMIALGGTLYSAAFASVSYGAALEANRNQNQTIGLRRIQINNINEQQQAVQKAPSESIEATPKRSVPSTAYPSFTKALGDKSKEPSAWADKVKQTAPLSTSIGMK